MSITLEESEIEHELFGEEAEKYRMDEARDLTEVDLFLENCSSLYSLILDAIHDLSAKSISCQDLEEMAANLEKAGRRLVSEQPHTDGTVGLRMNTISSAMEQLKLRRATSDSESSTSRFHPCSEVRTWIHSVEKKLKEHEKKLDTCPTSGLTKLLADQQILQLEIQSEGQILINRLNQQLRSSCSEDETKKKTTGDAIRKRWHTVYLNSLYLLCRIEEAITKRQSWQESETDVDPLAPPLKRARRSSGISISASEEDILPFHSSEYESIMDGRNTVTSVSSDESALEEKKWDSVQQDIGYSSGENSIHEALNTIAEHGSELDSLRHRLDAATGTGFYGRITREDGITDIDVVKAMEHDRIADPLSDSMHVNYDPFNTTTTFTEYVSDEVMALLGDDSDVPKSMNDSFHTQWREIAGRQATPRRQSRDFALLDPKHSCDASSEESSDAESKEDERPMMSRSYTSALLESDGGSLKRQRNSKNQMLNNSSSFLECSEMEASFCSTRSEMPPGVRSLRKRLRVRRMPRSMSDGEQLGIKNGILTPSIRISPPGTPLARSTRLLQQLDQQLEMRNESDTAQEQSDAPAYEWDEYNPPAKDDTMLDGSMAPSRVPEDLLSVDEDFGTHFSAQGKVRSLISESETHLKVVRKIIEHGDLDWKKMPHVEAMARDNVARLEQAQRSALRSSDSDRLRHLANQWNQLLTNVSSPVPNILSKVERFASSLRDLDELSSRTALNGISEIQTKDDARTALDAMQQIEKKLSMERDELRTLLSSQVFRTELSGVSEEFKTLSRGYDEAVQRIGCLVTSLQGLNTEWNEWNDRQKDIRQTMSVIEEGLKTGKFDQNTVVKQMELCQERMDSLETMCNYLTCSLQTLQDDGQGKKTPDFKAEILIYSNALEQLKSRFHDTMRVPTPPTPSVVPTEPTTPRKRKTQASTRSSPTQTTQTTQVLAEPEVEPSFLARAYKVTSSSFTVKVLLLLSLLSVILAIFCSAVLGTSFGPHLTYVNGPPPT